MLEHLRTHGPDYTVHIAEVLGVRNANVAGALTTLRTRELVHVDRHEPATGNTRVYYAAGAVTGRGRVTEIAAELHRLALPGRAIDWLSVELAAEEIAGIARSRQGATDRLGADRR